MDFFESQDAARRNTGKLILLFSLAVISLVVITNILFMVAFGFMNTEGTGGAGAVSVQFDWRTFAVSGIAIFSIVLLATLYRVGSLSGGGARIAEMMNGRLLVSGSGNLHEQRVLNVVEEMAIASGTPVPPVYVMEEAGINAFAAGYAPGDAVIGITRGAIETLSRDQLQGVVAHEFSHILHGDMRINIRLIGVLFGIMVLGQIGYSLLRSSRYSRRSAKGAGGIVLFGLGLLVVGYTGVFFGNLIKAAVSRQREFLADASAVQYTRNPDGIAGALMRIATHNSHSYLDNPKSEEISHALFEEGRVTPLRSLFATHPPLGKRLSAILPRWDGSYDLIAADLRGPAPEKEEAGFGPEPSRQDKFRAVLAGSAGALIADSLAGRVGNPDHRHLQYAGTVLREMPQALLAAAREPAGARALIYLLILDKENPTRDRQLGYLRDSADKGVYAELDRLLTHSPDVAPAQRLPLVEIAVSSLRQLSPPQYDLFRGNFIELIRFDEKISLFEWSLQKIVLHHLDSVFGKRRTRRFGKTDIGHCAGACSVMLSVLAHSGRHRGMDAESAFRRGAEELSIGVVLKPAGGIQLPDLNAALDALKHLKPLQKPMLLKACAAVIGADGEVQIGELELMRAIAGTIDCPMPPLLG